MFSSLLDAGRRNHWLSVKNREMVSMHDTSPQRGFQHYHGQDAVHMHVNMPLCGCSVHHSRLV